VTGEESPLGWEDASKLRYSLPREESEDHTRSHGVQRRVLAGPGATLTSNLEGWLGTTSLGGFAPYGFMTRTAALAAGT